jgi:hypothetical protein
MFHVKPEALTLKVRPFICETEKTCIFAFASRKRERRSPNRRPQLFIPYWTRSTKARAALKMAQVKFRGLQIIAVLDTGKRHFVHLRPDQARAIFEILKFGPQDSINLDPQTINTSDLGPVDINSPAPGIIKSIN